jgi:hypothetical protein
METQLNDRAQKRVRLSLLFGLIWLILPLARLSLMWLSNGPLGSLSPAGVALGNIIGILEKPGSILWVASGIGCVTTAFPEPKNHRSWQGKTAIFLAVLVLLSFLLLAFVYWLFS